MGKRAGGAKSGRGERGSAPLPKRKPRGGNGGGYKAEDFQDLVSQLKPLGLTVLKMDADGNCLFRSVADQLCGDENEHQTYRDKCCEHMMEHAEELSLFYVADDFESNCDSFESYVNKMQRPGTWGSQLELMAICQSYGVNAIVHQSGLPSYEMVFSPEADFGKFSALSLDKQPCGKLEENQCMQISYHDGEHFNSVRFSWDMEGPVKHLSLAQLKGNGEKLKGLVEQVTYSLPPDHGFDETTLKQTLLQSKEDVDLAVEMLLQKMAEGPSLGEAGPAGYPKQDSTAAVPAVADEEATLAPPAPRPRAEKRQERKAKAEAKKKAKDKVKNQESKEEGHQDQEAMKQLLCKQLLTV